MFQLPPVMTGQSNKGPVKLLRKPRAPAPIPAPPQSPPPKSYTSETYAHFIPAGSEHNNSLVSGPEARYHSKGASSYKPVGLTLRKGDLKYILDPIVREKTNLGTYVEGQNLVKPYRNRGPERFPPRLPKQPKPIPPSLLFDDHFGRYEEEPSFCLEDFIVTMSHVHHVPLLRTKQIMYSRQTYKKLHKLLSEYLRPKVESVSHVEIRPPCKYIQTPIFLVPHISKGLFTRNEIQPVT